MQWGGTPSPYGAAELKAETTGRDFGLQWRENTSVFFLMSFFVFPRTEDCALALVL